MKIMNIINKDEIMDKCLDKAIRLASIITNESEEQLQKRACYDAMFHAAIRHIAQMYFEFETNEAFRNSRELNKPINFK
jgi:hypothetical protein